MIKRNVGRNQLVQVEKRKGIKQPINQILF